MSDFKRKYSIVRFLYFLSQVIKRKSAHEQNTVRLKTFSSPEPRILCLRMTRGSGKCRRTYAVGFLWLEPYGACSLLVLT